MQNEPMEPRIKPIVRRVTVRDQAYDALHDAIVNGVFEAGAQLKISEIAAHLQISATPAKEALQRLESEGLVVGGAVAKAPPLWEIYLIRGRLHGIGARIAAEKITEEEVTEIAECLEQAQEFIVAGNTDELLNSFRRFHMLVVAASRNVFLFKFQKTLGPLILEPRRRCVEDADQAVRGLEAHLLVLEALKAHDPAESERLMFEHIVKAAEFALKQPITWNLRM